MSQGIFAVAVDGGGARPRDPVGEVAGAGLEGELVGEESEVHGSDFIADFAIRACGAAPAYPHER